VSIVVRISLREISRDGGEADRDPKLREFSPDLSGAPAVLICEFDDCLVAPVSKEGWNTAKEDRCEFEQMPHIDGHSARRHGSIPD
jgi:hypothetical protein